MHRLTQNPVALLLVTGILIGFNFPLGKLAAQAGISPAVWAFVFSLGACLLLLPLLLIQRKLRIPKPATLRYILLSALLSFIAPNLLLFSVLLEMGAGYMGLMFALSPVFTLCLAASFRLSVPNRLGLAGIFFGLLGTVVVSISKGSLPDAPSWGMIILAACVPLCLACGNVYRTMDWPKGGEPDNLAFWSHLAAVVFYVIVIVLFLPDAHLIEISNAPDITALQFLVSGLIFPFFFRLQQTGGPVLLSQIGYISAGVGLLTAVFILGESYELATWSGASIIAIGIALTIRAQQSPGPKLSQAKA